MEFAANLLQDIPEWTRAQMIQTIPKDKKLHHLPHQPNPVQHLYMTACTEDDGTEVGKAKYDGYLNTSNFVKEIYFLKNYERDK